VLFATPELTAKEESVIDEVDAVRTRLRHMLREPRRWYGTLRRTTVARNIQGSNSIEGYNVSLDDAVAVVGGQPPVDASDEDWNAVQGYSDAMTYILQLGEDAAFNHSAALIRSLHFMMLKHDLAAMPGRYRPGAVFVWSTAQQEVVYEGPASDIVPELVDELVDQLESDDGAPAIVRAGMAHLNLVMIHPFKDGNGRMARALQTLVLAREAILAPEFSSIEEYLGRNTPAYYSVLGEVGGQRWQPEGDSRPWVRFVLTAHYRQALTLERRIREGEILWESIDNERGRLGIDERTMGTLYSAAIGLRIRRPDHIANAEVSERVATTDLRTLVDAGLLEPIGEKRGRFYVAAEPLRQLQNGAREQRKPIKDPFDD
jgi:Fic family protein